MTLDISENNLSENSLRAFYSSLRAHNRYHSVKMTNLGLQAKCKDSLWFDLASALEYNKALVELDMRGNHINEVCLSRIIDSLKENTVMTELRLDISV